MRLKLFAITGILTLAPALGLIMASNPAHAQEDVVICATGSETDTYSPPVNDTTQTITNDGTDTTNACEWVHGLHVDTIYGQASFSGTFDGSCTSVYGPDSGTETWTWYSDSALTHPIGTSDWSYSSPGVDLTADGQSVEDVEGPITDGMFAGAVMDQSLILTTSLSECQTSGLAEQTGTFQLEVAGL